MTASEQVETANPDPSLCSNASLRKATRRLGQLYDQVLEPSGLRATQYTLLAHIRAGAGLSLRDLARALVMDLSALGHTLKPLMRDGYVCMAPDAQDRRVKRVYLTEAGEQAYDAATPLWATAHRRLEAIIGPDGAANLRSLTAQVASAEFQSAFASFGLGRG